MQLAVVRRESHWNDVYFDARRYTFVPIGADCKQCEEVSFVRIVTRVCSSCRRSSYRVGINDAETRATLERRADATGTRLENAQVSLTMVNYAKAPYGCVVLQALGPQDFTSHTNNLSVFLPPSTSESHVLRRRARSDPWILTFRIVKDPSSAGFHDKPCCSLSSIRRERRVCPYSFTTLIEISRRLD